MCAAALVSYLPLLGVKTAVHGRQAMCQPDERGHC